MYIIQKIVLRDSALRPEQLYLFFYLRFVLFLGIFGGKNFAVNIGGFNFIQNQSVALFWSFPLFDLGQTDYIKTESDWVSLFRVSPSPTK